MRKIILGLIWICTAWLAFADVKVSGIFSDNMVLQRGKPIPVCGFADADEDVIVEYNGVKATAKTESNGRFKAVLPALEIEKIGRDLIVEGKNRIAFTNVVVGDVWLVSGQSNAEMSFGWGILKGEVEMRKAKDYPNIRAIKFRHCVSPFPIKDTPCNKGSWKVATERTLPGITVEGYFMARELNAKTGVPIGILDNNWSGCLIEPFICEEGLALVPEFKNVSASLSRGRQAIAEWCRKAAAASDDAACGDAAGPMPDIPLWSRQHNAMIEPIVSFPICGATWYQGCSNSGDGVGYAKKLKALIGGWRAKWGYDFPFYIVQLASYTAKTTDPAGGNGFAKIREAQRFVAQKVHGTGLAVTIDIGNATDIHPKNKYDVGYRLSLWALRDIYGEKDIVVSGPIYRSIKIEGSRVRVNFDHVGSGLFAGEKGSNTPGQMPTATPDGKLRGFTIAGVDRKWCWADAVIDGETVLVSSRMFQSRLRCGMPFAPIRWEIATSTTGKACLLRRFVLTTGKDVVNLSFNKEKSNDEI